jgi:nitrite reductase/ring-hydroxylating ferredoxin subunit
VVNHAGEVRAWINRCPHVGTPLDRWPNEFYTHGALYEPVSGSCTAGPCAGDALTPLPLRRDGDLLVVTCR